jgi:hypothetical protein
MVGIYYRLDALRRNMHLFHLEIECQGEGLPAIASSVTRSAPVADLQIAAINPEFLVYRTAASTLTPGR